ncbi:MFS family permease [Nocardioides ginsengisegetis]|uniref:MFS family permease n=1 Tax=Nocardioides ginsengisegetis TaxID=661491 RepID=A0A7W3PBA1_9ACTN|nr:MFS family permease [Nocardioides ginsengisegetis]
MTDVREQPTWSPWRTVVWFGVVSLAADMVYEGARSITGPFLASLGASALVVGVVTGAGEAAALVLRLWSGPLADRSGRYWALTIVGYGLTVVCVPLMAVAPFLGGAGLAFGATMVLLERTGKAIRSPSKSALLAHAARSVGRGRGFAVHKALDQVGAFAGPLVVAGMVALTTHTWAGLAALAVPGVIALVLLAVIRARVPDMTVYDEPEAPLTSATGVRVGAPTKLPRDFRLFALSCAASTLGLMTFGIIGFHLADANLVRPALVPVVYAVAMGVEAISALATGFAYDRIGAKVLLVLPFLVAAVPLLALDDRLGLALTGVVVWGAAVGVQDSTVKALVADLVPSGRLATAYGVFAAFQGAAALAGGALAGWLYSGGRLDLVVVLGACQAVSLVLLAVVLRRRG